MFWKFWKQKTPAHVPLTLADRIQAFRSAVRAAITAATDARADRATMVALARELENQATQLRMRLAMG